MDDPTENRRKRNGTFAVGNAGGPGNPHVQQVARLRSAMLKTVSPKRMTTVINKLIDMAESGDLKAIELLLNRTLGKASGDSPGPQVAVQLNQTNTAGNVDARAILDRLRQRRGDDGEG